MIAVIAMMVSSKEKEDNPYCIEISEWKEAGLKVPSWARVDRIVSMDEWRMDSKIGELTQNDLDKFMQLIAEVQTETLHEFSLVAVTNQEGKYLQVYDEEWECWLFPYFKSEDPNKANIDKRTSDLLGEEVNTSYVAIGVHCKYSVKDKVYKQYRHKLYRLKLDMIPELMESNEFEKNVKKYAWKSIIELEKDDNVMNKNDDIVAFVKAKCI